MSKPKIVITIEGGMVTTMSSNTDVEMIILDYDNPENGGKIVDGIHFQDKLFRNGEAYKLISGESDEEIEALEFLKDINF